MAATSAYFERAWRGVLAALKAHLEAPLSGPATTRALHAAAGARTP